MKFKGMAKHFPHSIGSAPATRERGGRSRAVKFFAVYVAVGALVLSVLPGSKEGLALVRAAQDGAARASAGTNGELKRPSKASMRPLKEFLARARRTQQQGKLDLRGPLSVTIDADRAEDGTLSNAKFSGPSAGNPRVKQLAQEFVAALNESRALQFLEDAPRVQMTFSLEGERFAANGWAEARSEPRAAEMARGYRTLINLGRIVKRGTDEGVLLNNMKVSSSGKQLVMNLEMSREAIGNILLKQITPN